MDPNHPDWCECISCNEEQLLEAGYDPTNYYPEYLKLLHNTEESDTEDKPWLNCYSDWDDDDQLLDSFPDEARDDGP